MKIQRLLIGLTLVNLALLIFTLSKLRNEDGREQIVRP